MSNSPQLSDGAKGFLDFLDDDLLPETILGKRGSFRRGGSAVGFLDFIEESDPSDLAKIEKIVIKKQNSKQNLNSGAMGFLEFSKEGEDKLDLSFPPHPVLKQLSQSILTWAKEEWLALLLCYRGFSKTVEILNVWASVFYQNKKNLETSKFLVERLRLWMQTYPTDFQSSDVMDRLKDIWLYVVDRPTSMSQDLGLKEILSPSLLTRKSSSSEGRRATTDSEANSTLQLTELEPTEIARVLTIDEFEIFADVPPLEFVTKGGWLPKETKTPNLDKLSERFNKVSRWVTTSVVCSDDQHKLDVFLKFIVIAFRCRQINNFNTMMEIVSGLNQSSVLLLKNLWSAIPPKIQKKWEEMNQLADPLGNFRNYRRELKSKAMLENRKKVPVLPYIPVFLRDCLFFNEGNSKPDMNVMVQFWSTVEQIRRFQNLPYSFTVDLKTAIWISNNFVIKDEEELFRMAARSRPTIASREEMFGDIDRQT